MSESCKLLELPPVGECSHMTGHCFCNLCTCGQHSCPGDAHRNEKYLKSSMASMYKKDYSKPKYLKSQAYLRPDAMNYGSSRMDLNTINKLDYIAHSCEKTKSARFERKNHLGVLKFAGVSNYRSEFPNWGSYQFINIGNMKAPYKDPGVKFTPQTTYSHFHSQSHSSQEQLPLKKPISSNPLTAGKIFLGRTTSQESFKDFSKGGFPEIIKNKTSSIFQMETVPKCYETMYKSNFDLKPATQIYIKKNGRL